MVDQLVPMNPLTSSQVTDSSSGSESGSDPGSPYPQQGILDFSETELRQADTGEVQPVQADTSAAQPQQAHTHEVQQQDTSTDIEPSAKRRKIN